MPTDRQKRLDKLADEQHEKTVEEIEKRKKRLEDIQRDDSEDGCA